MRKVESNRNIVYNCKYHVVFCPKYRKKVLVPPVSERLKELFGSKAKELQKSCLTMYTYESNAIHSLESIGS